PALIEGLLTLHQLTLITANHQPLVEELFKSRQITSAKQLVELTDAEWQSLIAISGVPENVEGTTIEEKRSQYIILMKNILHAAFPTQKIFDMVKRKELPVKDANVATGIENFLSRTPDFDIRSSRIYNFESQIRNIAPDNFAPVTKELKRIQRLFQISPTAESLKVLMDSEIQSAYDISSFSEKSFIRTFSEPLGGEDIAGAVYQRSSFNSVRSENFAMKMQEHTTMAVPGYVLSLQQQQESMVALKNLIPNYSDLFGSPDICECDHCRSVYSPAAYFVDLLRFLWRGDKNADNKSPLDMLKERRPDLLHLPLTCENTHTIIPYIDLANEVMEYYTAHNMLDNKAAYDTGDTTAEELRASPQNFNVEAYEILKGRIYPFTLPYHQPLDVIRTYSDHLNTSREDVMRHLQIDFSQTTACAISAEALRLSPEEYAIISERTFNDQPDGHTAHAYFGFSSSNEMQQKLKEVNEFLKRTGVSYTELVELIKTKFINPEQSTLDFLQDLFSGSEMNPSLIYSKLEQIENGSFSPQQNDPLVLALGN
ncbi:MAG: Tc toxin subunit A, partial [Flavisolibacter sp.]